MILSDAATGYDTLSYERGPRHLNEPVEASGAAAVPAHARPDRIAPYA